MAIFRAGRYMPSGAPIVTGVFVLTSERDESVKACWLVQATGLCVSHVRASCCVQEFDASECALKDSKAGRRSCHQLTYSLGESRY